MCRLLAMGFLTSYLKAFLGSTVKARRLRERTLPSSGPLPRIVGPHLTSSPLTLSPRLTLIPLPAS